MKKIDLRKKYLGSIYAVIESALIQGSEDNTDETSEKINQILIPILIQSLQRIKVDNVTIPETTASKRYFSDFVLDQGDQQPARPVRAHQTRQWVNDSGEADFMAAISAIFTETVATVSRRIIDVSVKEASKELNEEDMEEYISLMESLAARLPNKEDAMDIAKNGVYRFAEIALKDLSSEDFYGFINDAMITEKLARVHKEILSQITDVFIVLTKSIAMIYLDQYTGNDDDPEAQTA